jgi:hypothetical protein
MFQIGFPTSKKFSGFFLIFYLFSWAEYGIQVYFNFGKALTLGAHLSAAKPPRAVCRLAARGSAVRHARWHKRPASTAPVRAAVLSERACRRCLPLSALPPHHCRRRVLRFLNSAVLTSCSFTCRPPEPVTAAAVNLTSAARSFHVFPPPKPW